MDSLFDLHPLGSSPEELERRILKLQKINASLMQRVERSMDQQANAYSLFQAGIALESQVRLRTEELTSALARLERTNDELSSARDASERANRFKTRFFTAVGHDLLQPLHAARLSASALAEAGGDERQSAIAERIEYALVTIEELLKSILDISKLEAGVVTPVLRPVPLDALFILLGIVAVGCLAFYRPLVGRGAALIGALLVAVSPVAVAPAPSFGPEAAALSQHGHVLGRRARGGRAAVRPAPGLAPHLRELRPPPVGRRARERPDLGGRALGHPKGDRRARGRPHHRREPFPARRLHHARPRGAGCPRRGPEPLPGPAPGGPRGRSRLRAHSTPEDWQCSASS